MTDPKPSKLDAAAYKLAMFVRYHHEPGSEMAEAAYSVQSGLADLEARLEAAERKLETAKRLHCDLVDAKQAAERERDEARARHERLREAAKFFVDEDNILSHPESSIEDIAVIVSEAEIIELRAALDGEGAESEEKESDSSGD